MFKRGAVASTPNHRVAGFHDLWIDLHCINDRVRSGDPHRSNAAPRAHAEDESATGGNEKRPERKVIVVIAGPDAARIANRVNRCRMIQLQKPLSAVLNHADEVVARFRSPHTSLRPSEPRQERQKSNRHDCQGDRRFPNPSRRHEKRDDAKRSKSRLRSRGGDEPENRDEDSGHAS